MGGGRAEPATEQVDADMNKWLHSALLLGLLLAAQVEAYDFDQVLPGLLGEWVLAGAVGCR